jgi:hypothetical protein
MVDLHCRRNVKNAPNRPWQEPAPRCEKNGSLGLGGIGQGPEAGELETALGRLRGSPEVARRLGRARDGPPWSDDTAPGWTGS